MRKSSLFPTHPGLLLVLLHLAAACLLPPLHSSSTISIAPPPLSSLSYSPELLSIILHGSSNGSHGNERIDQPWGAMFTLRYTSASSCQTSSAFPQPWDYRTSAHFGKPQTKYIYQTTVCTTHTGRGRVPVISNIFRT